MINIAETTSHTNSRVTPAAGSLAATTPPIQPLPVPGNLPLIPPEIPEIKEPLGTPSPTENPIPVREPPMTTPPQS